MPNFDQNDDDDQNDAQNDDDEHNDADEIESSESSSSEPPTEVLDREILHLQVDIEYLTKDLNRADADFTENSGLKSGNESQSKKR